MTEAEWLGCDDPRAMLQLLHSQRGGRHPRGISVDDECRSQAVRPLSRSDARKLRLFAVACCRRVWRALTDERSRRAVEVAERYADGEADDAKLRTALQAAQAAWIEFGAGHEVGAAREAVSDDAYEAAYWAHAYTFDPERRESDRREKAILLRCLFGSPFRPPPVIGASVLAWNDAAGPRIAAAIYEDRRFEDLPILADALEEAGCTDADLLTHCRGGGEHARGCWAVDAVLAKS